MSNYRIAVRYAKSLIELSIEKKVLEKVRYDMEMIDNLCRGNRAFLMFLKNPIIHSYRKWNILKEIFEGKIHEVTFAFLEIVARKSRESVLPEIAIQFLVQYRDYKKIKAVEVLTPFKLNQELKKEIKKLAENYIERGWTIELKERVDDTLIGGFVLKIGDKQIDSSVLSKLREFRKQLVVS